ncbi:MAG: DUF917 domain-containing protein [Candidatus Heimdallarchaeota archaeon]
MQLERRTDFEDLIFGAKILGCGGGGEEALARTFLERILAEGLKVTVLDPKTELSDNALLCVTGMVGGRKTHETLAIIEGLEEINKDPMLSATRLLEQFLDEKFYALVSTEIGAGNFFVPIYVSAKLGIGVIDGDLCGRAKPEISISTSNIAGLSITPLAIVSAFGDELLLKSAQTDQRAEAIAREMAVLSGGTVGVARCPAYWSAYQKAVIPGTMSWAQKIGTTIRLALENGQQPLKSLLSLLTSPFQPSEPRYFHAHVENFEVADRAGFVIGEISLKDNKGHCYRVWFKNEFLVIWRDDTPIASAPDLLCIVDAKTCEGLTPWENDFFSGREVVVIITKNHPLWYTSRGLELFSPKHFGFTFNYPGTKV